MKIIIMLVSLESLVTFMAHNTEKPILVFLLLFNDLENYFTVIGWEQDNLLLIFYLHYSAN